MEIIPLQVKLVLVKHRLELMFAAVTLLASDTMLFSPNMNVFIIAVSLFIIRISAWKDGADEEVPSGHFSFLVSLPIPIAVATERITQGNVAVYIFGENGPTPNSCPVYCQNRPEINDYDDESAMWNGCPSFLPWMFMMRAGTVSRTFICYLLYFTPSSRTGHGPDQD